MSTQRFSDDHSSDERPEGETRAAPDSAGQDADGYEPPSVTALGSLPASTGMPASPQSVPSDPSR
jgi:hypothetical protein